MNLNPTPKEEFLKNAQAATDHRVLVENAITRRSIDTALAEYLRRQTMMNPPDLANSALCFMRCQGAQELVSTLYNLAESASPTITRDQLNLPSNVKPLPAKRN